MDCQRVKFWLGFIERSAKRGEYYLANGNSTGVESQLQDIETCIRAIRREQDLIQYAPVDLRQVI